MSAKNIVVIDAGHGGIKTTGGSSWNNATSASGVLEKTMTLKMAKLVREGLKSLGLDKVYLTRNGDVNLGLSARANVAANKKADVFLSIHFNGFNKKARGVETLIRGEHGNYNYPADKKFAQRIQKAVYGTIKSLDSGTRNRGVKAQRLGVLSDPQLGNTPAQQNCVSCLSEIEFIDVPAVDELLNGTGSAARVKKISDAIAGAIIEELET